MSSIRIHITADTRQRLQKDNPELLAALDRMNANEQTEINNQWNHEQGTPQWGSKR